ncbi:hypothetical protein BB934_43965 (plasmid) [Microvirga ossetica]|uniref:Uncharacterized protein n=1 Tax=Microvirga ossetica TaxID=1882682 RepID=A0A1B2EYX5_9HYPH|nr:hypothetical protein BB934_43965 [Microvirga ossetica]
MPAFSATAAGHEPACRHDAIIRNREGPGPVRSAPRDGAAMDRIRHGLIMRRAREPWFASVSG